MIAVIAYGVAAPEASARPGAPVCDVELIHVAATAPAMDESARFGHGRIIRGKRRPGGASAGPYYVALTFDDGPDHETTPRVLDALEAYEVPATFFVVGWRFASQHREVHDNRDVLHDIAARGFPIGNHTFEHDDLRTLPPARVRAEIDRAARALEAELGYRPRLFRAPFGRLSRAARQHLRARGYTPVRWSIDPADYRRRRAGRLTREIMAALRKLRGGIVVLHDTKRSTADELPRLLAALEAENCWRRERDEPLLIPVTLDYFMRDENDAQRPIAPAARAREQRYLDRLARVCGVVDKNPSSH